MRLLMSEGEFECSDRHSRFWDFTTCMGDVSLNSTIVPQKLVTLMRLVYNLDKEKPYHFRSLEHFYKDYRKMRFRK